MIIFLLGGYSAVIGSCACLPLTKIYKCTHLNNNICTFFSYEFILWVHQHLHLASLLCVLIYYLLIACEEIVNK